jgi:hypothetical protein
MPDSSEGDRAGSTQSAAAAPAVIVHGLAAAAAAVRAADPRRGLVLLSAPGAGAHAGAGWFLALCRQAAATRPQLRVQTVLDCAGSPGAVLAALRVGVPTVVFTGDPAIARRLEQIAAGCGARLLRVAPRALDLAGFRPGDARWAQRLERWLAGGAG